MRRCTYLTICNYQYANDAVNCREGEVCEVCVCDFLIIIANLLFTKVMNGKCCVFSLAEMTLHIAFGMLNRLLILCEF